MDGVRSPLKAVKNQMAPGLLKRAKIWTNASIGKDSISLSDLVPMSRIV